eukprot:4321948-Pleurochrysis_carterae.AAC.2
MHQRLDQHQRGKEIWSDRKQERKTEIGRQRWRGKAEGGREGEQWKERKAKNGRQKGRRDVLAKEKCLRTREQWEG